MKRWYETGLHPFFDKMAWDRTAFIFMTRLYETGLHPFLWQDCMRQDCIHFYDKMAWDRTASIFMTSHFYAKDGMRQDCIHFYDKIAWDRTASIFMTRWHETGLHHPFLWHKIVTSWGRTASIFMTRWHETGLHPFLSQHKIVWDKQDCIHFYDKMAWDRTASIFWQDNQYSSIFMTSWHKTGAHPFYIGMYIHIYTHIYVHIYTSQKECLRSLSLRACDRLVQAPVHH